MSQNKYFNDALAGFTAEYAYADSVRHLYDAGLSVEEIKKQLLFPVSAEKIKKVIEEYETNKNSPDGEYIFIEDIDKYGRKSFRRIKKIQ